MDSNGSIAPAQQPYTLLRIKRKRNEEPLDALVVESRERRKKSKGGLGVFQFAHTVEGGAWDDEKQQKVIQDQISRLAREPTIIPENEPTSESSIPTSKPTTTKGLQRSSRRYTILTPSEEPTFSKHPTNPPKVISVKDLPSTKVSRSDFRLYDAVLSKEDRRPAPAVDPEMEKFIPLLNDYLKLHDIRPEAAAGGLPTDSHLGSDSEDDYVWDVFYHRPATLTEWNAAANVGMITGPLPSDIDPYDSFSDEEEDEADEDSNAEEYYKNDYPDEEDSPWDSEDDKSDEWHEGSEYDDIFGRMDDDSDEDF
ncbi:hypothetical protein AX16_003530 [Volvariella volvacea WC 439]|nr:hypothetical protein AX16_003530 [Volvariella volvacea WC 439]